MEDFVSVIVPVYKVEKFLPVCIDSIINQTYKNLDIILVDDGSPDLSGNICDQYAGTDNRIRVIHQQNAGPSSARNAGLDIASGEYVVFVDSDDYIDIEMIDTMLRLLKENEGDLIRCPFQCVSENENHPFRSTESIGEISEYTPRDAFDIFINAPYCATKQFIPGVWGAVYKKSLFDHIRFPDGLIYEEGFVLPKLFLQCRKLLFVPKPFLYYRINRRGIIATSVGTDLALGSIDDWREIHFLLADRYPEFTIETCRKWIQKYIVLYHQIENSPHMDQDHVYKNYIRKELKEHISYFQSTGIEADTIHAIEQIIALQ